MRRRGDTDKVGDEMYVKLKDIAERVGVSVNTVSRALRNGSDIGEETKRKVCELADEMGYVPNDIHSYTFGGVSKIIGVVIPSTTNPFVFIMLSKLIAEIEKVDYSPLIVRCDKGMMHEEHLKDLLKKRVCGIIAFNNTDNKVAQKVRQYKIPFVMVGENSRGRDINAVFIDDVKCGELIGEELEKSNRKKPCYVSVVFSDKNQRELRFVEKAKALRLNCDMYNFDYNSIDPSEIVCSKIIENKNDFIYCFNDEIALNIKTILDLKGYAGYDIYGIDGLSAQMPFLPRMNSLMGDYSDMVHIAVERVFEILNNQDAEYKTVQIACPVSLVKY